MRCPFKIGEKIVCIKTYESGIITTSLDRQSPATIGKTYEVSVAEGRMYDNICITGDHGCKFIPNWDFFISKKSYRKQKLENLKTK